MWIFTRPPDQIREEDLRGLIRDRVQESVTLDFKRDMYGGSDAEIRKMLRDVASLANANGGVLIIGMAENADATGAELVPVARAEVEAQRLIASCAANIADRIAGLSARPVPLEAGGEAVLVWIPPSYSKPHMITFQGGTELWIRHDRQNARMSVAELRAATMATEDLAMKVDRAVRSRMGVWEESDRDLFALMATPLLLQEGRIDTSDPRLGRALARVPAEPRHGGSFLTDRHSNVVPTLRGRAARDRNDPSTRSLEVYRTGYVEFLLLDLSYLAGRAAAQAPITIHGWAVAEFSAVFTRFVRDLRELTGIIDPYVFTLCLRKCDGWILYERQREPFGLGPFFAWDEGNLLQFGSIFGAADEAPDITAQRIADRFWNAFHFERCPFFDAEGRLTLRN